MEIDSNDLETQKAVDINIKKWALKIKVFEAATVNILSKNMFLNSKEDAVNFIECFLIKISGYFDASRKYL